MKQQKQDRRSLRTRHLVCSAMIELLSEKRYDAITVQDLLDRANIGRSTFYAHYFDKEDVLASLLEQILELRQPLSRGDGGRGIIPSRELFQLAYQHHPQQFQAMVQGHAGELLWEAMQTALCRDIEQTLTHAYTEKRSSSVPLAGVAQYLAGAFLSLFKWWLSAGMPFTPEQMDRLFQQLTLSGVWATVEGKSE